MAGNIKGITIEIGGDTQKLNKALEDVNKQGKSLQSELKQVEKLLKLDPKNTELVAQKQKLLADAVANSKEKLDRLKTAQEQVNEQFKRGEISEEQYRAFQREVAKTEQELQGFEKQLKSTTEASKSLGEKMKDAGEKMKNVGDTMTKYVTVPLVAAGAGATAMGKSFDDAYDKIRIGTGATGKALEGLNDDFRKVAKQVPSSFDDISTAIADYNTRLGISGQALQDLSVQTLNLARITDSDLSKVIEETSQSFQAFNVPAEEYGESLDYIFKVSQNTGIGIDRLQQNLVKFAPALKQMGFDFQESAALMGFFDKAGVEVEQAMTGLNKALVNMAKAGVTDANEALQKLFDEIKNAPSDIKATELAIEIFGSKAGPLMASAIREGKLEYEELVKELMNSKETINGVADETDDWAEGLAKLKNKVLIATEPIATTLFDAINNLVPLLEKAVKPIEKLAEGFANLPQGVQVAILAVVGLVAAIGPLLQMIGTVVIAMPGLTALFGGVGVAAGGAAAGTGLFGGALAALTGPVGLAIAGVAALTVGGIALYKHLQNDAVPAVQLFGDETSKATEKAVGAYMDLDAKAGQSLMNLKLTGETVTKEMANSLTETFAQMAETITAGMEKDFAESTASMQYYLATSNALGTEEESQILANMQTGYEQRKQAVADGEAQIKEILSTASQEKRSLTQAELTEIGNIQQQMKTQAVQVLSETELESKAILERMRQQADELTAQQAADVAKNSTEQKNKAIKAAEEQYNDVIKEIIRQRDEAGTISNEQADKLIADATRQKDEAIKKAEEMHLGIIDEAKKLAGEHVDLVDWQTGEIKSKWEVLREKLGLEGNNIYLAMVGPAGWVVLSAQRTVEFLEEMRQKALAKFTDLKDGALRKVEELKTGLDNIIQRIKDAFANLRIEIPKPKLPHINVNWKSVGVGDARVSIPDFNINWYKTGGIFDRPSVIGVGEAGTEAVIPLDKLPGLIAGALRDAMGGNQLAMAGGITVQNMYVRNDQDIKLVARELYNLQQQNARGRGLR